MTKCEGCPLVCEACRNETGEGFWCPSPNQNACHLTPQLQGIIKGMITGELIGRAVVVGFDTFRGEDDISIVIANRWDAQCSIWDWGDEPEDNKFMPFDNGDLVEEWFFCDFVDTEEVDWYEKIREPRTGESVGKGRA